MADNPRPDRLSSIAELLKAILWPALALIAFLVWRQPITEVIQTIPSMAQHSNEFSLGPLTIKGEASRLPDPPSDVAQALRKLDTDKFQLLIKTGDNDQVFDPKDQRMLRAHQSELATAHALAKDGLVEFRRSSDPKYTQEYRLTPLGLKTYTYFVDSLSKLVVTPTK